MRIKSVEVKNFKSIEHCKFDLTDVTLLVGANNAGKSSILQALHFGATLMKQASEANKPSTLPIDATEYLPTEHYKKLSRGATEWGNQSIAPESQISFTVEIDDVLPGLTKDAEASITIKAARNTGLSLTPTINSSLFPIFRKDDVFSSAYIPGLAGIPLKEEYLTQKHVFRKVASGDSNVVLRNILFMLKKKNKIGELLNHLNHVYSGLSLKVEFDEQNDYYIDCQVSTHAYSPTSKPIEFAGTGLLQVIQIFSYLILFKPKLLLIDEPESHLHPTMQTKLIRAIEKQVSESGTRAIITTHSPFVARGLPVESRSVWIRDGNIAASTQGNEIKTALGWGAIDRKTIICSEDGNVDILNRILDQKTDVADKVSVMPFGGVSKLGTGDALRNFKSALGNEHRILVHRDRDCMSEAELVSWKNEYQNKGLETWVTEFSDIEAYFCTAEHVAAALGIHLADAQQIIDSAIADNADKFRLEFNGKRKEINKKIYEVSGGSPNIEELWNTLDDLQKIKGKSLLSAIRSKAKSLGNNEKLIGRANAAHTVAEDLFQIVSTN